MKILMIAPEPIFEPRGTPLSVVGRCKALSDMGYEIELLTYNIGEDVSFPGLTINRIASVPGISKIKIGPSAAKLPLDFLLMLKTFSRLLTQHYDFIHTHEEAGFWGTLFAKIFRLPHLYDMHSSLPQQLSNFQFSKSKLLIWIFEKMELWVLKNARSVITICPDLHDHVQQVFPDKGSTLIENVIDYGMIFGETDRSAERRKELDLKGRKVALYTGTFEAYQGLDLLLESAKEVLAKRDDVLFVLVGGHADQVNFYRDMAVKAGIADRIRFTGQVKPNEVGSYIRCADVLLSPRTRGTNTPLKVYAYFRSRVPIVATRLHTHTQVMNDEVSQLTEPNALDFAKGILTVMEDDSLAEKLSGAAVKLAEKEYSYDAYITKLTLALKPFQAKEV